MDKRSVVVAWTIAIVTCGRLSADDKWDVSQFFNDDSVATTNQLIHGAVQTHDVQGSSPGPNPTDRDFSFVASKAGHSYDVRVFSNSVCFLAGSGGGCCHLDRVERSPSSHRPASPSTR